VDRRLAAKTRRSGSTARVPGSASAVKAAVLRRWRGLARTAKLALWDGHADLRAYSRNIENVIGTVTVPVGVAGPLRIHGLFAGGDYWVPLATTEATLVASYNRGAHAITDAGGASALLVMEGVTRSPGFVFDRAAHAVRFAAWIVEQLDAFRAVAARTTRYGRLEDLRLTLEANHLYVHLDFSTGNAAGQNMVTLAAQAICEYIAARSPIPPRRIYVEANMSGDKKASAHSFQNVRGKLATAEVRIPRKVIASRLRTTPEAMVDYWRISALGGVLSGTIGVQGHFANGLAALFLATGQDIACVSEAAVGVTRMELTRQGGLYAAVTLPNLIVGTIGGGTGLPTQAACLALLGLQPPGTAQALAEIAAALCLAGELSIIAALSAGHFGRAHEKLARAKKSRAPSASK
jgi:hydroxymethylglutaryl-CoA reductase (NADPH)